MIDYATLPYVVEPMQENDIEQVMLIEHEAFAAPWTANAYRHELHQNELAHYRVVRKQRVPALATLSARKPPRPIWRTLFGTKESHPAAAAPIAVALSPVLAYGGFWIMVDEAHISTIATARAWRGKHLGELILVGMIEQAQDLGAKFITLEVRMSNTVAQNLYHKYRFTVQGRRKRYYSDNGEDALIMTTDEIDKPAFQQAYTALKAQLWERLRTEST